MIDRETEGPPHAIAGRRRALSLGLVVTAVLLVAAGAVVLRATGYRPPARVKVDSASVAPAMVPVAGNPDVLKVAVSAMISPADTIESYRGIADYLGAELGMPVQVVVRKSYGEVNGLLAKGEVDLAFVCTGAYALDRDDGYMDLLAAPIVHGQRSYYSDIIVPIDSEDRSLGDLRGERFALTDPMSNTGRFAPQRLIETRGLDSETYFAQTIYTGSHDKSIEAVANRVVDGAAVDHLILEALRRSGDPASHKVRIVERIGPYGMPPVVVRNTLEPSIRQRLLDALLVAHEHSEVRASLERTGIESFRVPADAEYDSVFEQDPVAEPFDDDD